MDILQQVENEAVRPLRYWCQDESRFGLKTITRRVITALGIKPVGPVQWTFQSFWLYGAIEPLSGENFFLEFSHLDADCFQWFLNEFSKTYPHSLNVIQLDNGRFHSAKKLVIPDNVVLYRFPVGFRFHGSCYSVIPAKAGMTNGAVFDLKIQNLSVNGIIIPTALQSRCEPH
ncbi:MAG: transposase [Candidatus Competibacteraceae bacterium]|nr:MAG: transposase [Candidatus Competibacteraceae bacterium]